MESVSFSLVRDPELHPQCPLETERLFVDGKPLPWHPHFSASFVEMLEQPLDLPERIRFLLLHHF
jgi:hypothetical protein